MSFEANCLYNTTIHTYLSRFIRMTRLPHLYHIMHSLSLAQHYNTTFLDYLESFHLLNLPCSDLYSSSADGRTGRSKRLESTRAS